jgi:hypothetical protein
MYTVVINRVGPLRGGIAAHVPSLEVGYSISCDVLFPFSEGVLNLVDTEKLSSQGHKFTIMKTLVAEGRV